MIEAVFDTNIFLQAALSDVGPAFACWEFVEAGKVRIWATQATILELEDVLTRDKLQRGFNSARRERIATVLTTFLQHISIVEQPPEHFNLSRDADDEVFLNLAIEISADYLVTRDRDLLDLSDDSEFSSKFPTLQIVNPIEFLQVVRNT